MCSWCVFFFLYISVESCFTLTQRWEGGIAYDFIYDVFLLTFPRRTLPLDDVTSLNSNLRCRELYKEKKRGNEKECVCLWK